MVNQGHWATGDTGSKDKLNSALMQYNVIGSRPAFGQTGRMFYATDTNELWRDNGSGWDSLGTFNVSDHAQAHTLVSHSDTDMTGAEGNTLTGGGETDLHTHASDPAQADQTAIEAETNQDTYVPPDLLRKAPGAVKYYGRVTGPGALSSGSYNLDSATKDATGRYTVTITTDFSGTIYAHFATLDSLITVAVGIGSDNSAAGTVRVTTATDGSGPADIAFHLHGLGDQ